jgi:hypothetical protein
MHRLAITAAMLLALAACQDRTTTAPPATTSSGSSILSNEPPSYGAVTPRERALQGCAGGQTADILHQNRPGGSDYDPARCRTQGY